MISEDVAYMPWLWAAVYDASTLHADIFYGASRRRSYPIPATSSWGTLHTLVQAAPRQFSASQLETYPRVSKRATGKIVGCF